MINIKHSMGIRLGIIAFLAIALLIPSFLIQDLISEREHRRSSVASEISQKWGSEQSIVGPLVSVPYKDYYKSGDDVTYVIRYAHFLPESLNVKGTVTPEVRYRSSYEVIVYNSKLSVSGNFPSINLNAFNVPRENFIPEDAFVSVGISDMTGIKEFVTIHWDDKNFLADPGIASGDVLESGISISPGFEEGKEHHFNFELNLNGSSALLFSPVGKQTTLSFRPTGLIQVLPATSCRLTGR